MAWKIRRNREDPTYVSCKWIAHQLWPNRDDYAAIPEDVRAYVDQLHERMTNGAKEHIDWELLRNRRPRLTNYRIDVPLKQGTTFKQAKTVKEELEGLKMAMNGVETWWTYEVPVWRRPLIQKGVKACTKLKEMGADGAILKPEFSGMLSVYCVKPDQKPRWLMHWRENLVTGAGKWEFNLDELAKIGVNTNLVEMANKMEEE